MYGCGTEIIVQLYQWSPEKFVQKKWTIEWIKKRGRKEVKSRSDYHKYFEGCTLIFLYKWKASDKNEKPHYFLNTPRIRLLTP